MKSMGLAEEEAEVLIHSRQEERNTFIKHFTNMNNTDPKLYHLIINNEKSDIDEMANMIYTRTLAFFMADASGWKI